MPLIECPECKGQVSDTVHRCPHCGFCLKKCCGHHHGCFPMIPLFLFGAVIIVFMVLVFTAGVNVNSNNGMINFHWNRRGIFPRIKLNIFKRGNRCGCRCDCSCKKK